MSLIRDWYVVVVVLKRKGASNECVCTRTLETRALCSSCLSWFAIDFSLEHLFKLCMFFKVTLVNMEHRFCEEVLYMLMIRAATLLRHPRVGIGQMLRSPSRSDHDKEC